MSKFKDERQASVYQYCRIRGVDSTEVNRKFGGVIREAYHKGRAGLRAMWPRTSMAYAAWAAGRDDARSQP